MLQETLGYKMSSIIPREYRDAFVARVRKARTDAGYTQRAVATLLGVDASTYNNYERRAADANASAPDRALLRSLPSSNRLACDRQRNSTKSSSSKITKTESFRGQPEARLIELLRP